MTLHIKKRLIYCMVCLLCMSIAALAYLKAPLAAAEGDTAGTRVTLSAEGAGYYAGTQPHRLDSDTAMYFEMDIVTIITTGSGEIAFALNSGNPPEGGYMLRAEGQGDPGMGIGALYGDDGNRFIVNGRLHEGVYNSNPALNKSAVFVEGKTLRATFDAAQGVYILEQKDTDAVVYEEIHRVTGLNLEDGDYICGIQLYDSASFVAENISSSVLFSDAATAGLPLTYQGGLSVEEGAAYTLIESEGISYIANSTPQTPIGGDIIFTIRIVDFYANDDARIGFGIGTDLSGGSLYGGEGALMLYFGSEMGITRYSGGESALLQSDLNLANLLYTGVQIKAVFSPALGNFMLSVKWSEETPFSIIQTVTGLDMAQENLYCGMQLEGSVNIKTSYYSVYSPGTPQTFGWENKPMTPAPPLVVQNSGKKFVLTQESAKSVPSGYYYPSSSFNVGEDQSVAVYVDNLHNVVNSSPSNHARLGFTFSNSVDNPVWLYDSNINYTMFYEETRATTYMKRPAPEETLFLSLGDSHTFYDVTKNSSSLLAVYTPSSNQFRLFVMLAGEADFSLVHQYTLPSRFLDSTKLYPSISFYGGMTIEVNSIKCYKLNTADIVDYEGYAAAAGGGIELVQGGHRITAHQDGYIHTQSFDPGNNDIAFEYQVEGFSFSAGTYNLGFLLTEQFDANILPGKNGGVFLSYLPSNDLTSSVADRMRAHMFKDGNTVRIVLHLRENRYSLQYKKTGTYTWMTFLTAALNAEQQFPAQGAEVTAALHIQEGADLKTENLKIYLISGAGEPAAIAAHGQLTAQPKENVSLFSVNLSTGDSAMGRVYLSGNNALAGGEPTFNSNIEELSEITINAEEKKGYLFTGWYSGGKRLFAQPQVTFEVVKNTELRAEFVPATLIKVINGAGDGETVFSGYYADGSGLGINPHAAPEGYVFHGFTISVEQTYGDVSTVLRQYTLIEKSRTDKTLRNNILGSTEFYLWSAISSDLTDEGIYPISTDGGYNLIDLGGLRVLDSTALATGTLEIIIPNNVKHGENGSESYISVRALYSAVPVTNNKQVIIARSESYKRAMEAIRTTDIVIVCAVAVVTGGMVIIKILGKKRQGKEG